MRTIKGTIDSMPTNMTTSSHSDEVCRHEIEYGGKTIVKEWRKILLPDGTKGCPRCYCENDTKRMMEEQGICTDSVERHKKKLYFEKYSMIKDTTIKEATLENYTVENSEMEAAKKTAEEYIQFVSNGRITNLIIQGQPGVGKSHVAHSICVILNDGSRKVMYVSISELVRRIKDTFRKDAKDSEHAIIERMIVADILVLDDLGAEVGNIDSHGAASDFISRVMFSVLDGRQGKCTIFTTNLTGAKIKQIYDMRIVSRMTRNPQYIIFKETKDYRNIKLPF